MMLPELKYAWRQTQRDVLAIRGINYSDELADGDLADSAGLSTRRYPYFATRNARPEVDGYTDVAAVYRYKDSIFTVVGEKLFWTDLNNTEGAQYLHTVLTGAKQFVTVNTKVILFPDKLMIDMTTEPPTVRDMAASFDTVGTDTVMTSDTLTIPNVPRTDKQALESGFKQGANPYLQAGFWFKTYTGLKWENNEYDLTEATVKWKEVGGAGAQGGEYQIVPGDILIPVAVGTDAMRAQVHATTNGYTPAYCPETAQDDLTTGGGYYLQVKEIIGDIVTGENGRIVENRKITYNVFKFGEENPALRSIFRAGDAISISGHPLPINNKEAVIVNDVTDEVLTFDSGTFTPADYTGNITQSTMDALAMEQGEESYVKFGSVCMFAARKHDGDWCFADAASGTIHYKKIKAGQMLFSKGSSYYVLDVDESIFQCYAVTASGTYPSIDATPVPSKLTITRSMPQIDYICEKDNRLWGVVNHQHNRVWDKDAGENGEWKEFDSRMIVASSLGEPDDFYDYTGAYGGAYAVAVASEGDFTGICAYGDSVLAWKEKKLCKVMGDYPANYSMHEYVVDGLQAGAHGTQVNISETLLYKGVNGVYAYGGGTPRLISPQFGQRRYIAEAAGTDGERYYITLTDAAGATHLHSYDVQRGLWLRESGENAIGYVDLPAGFCALLDDGKLYRMDNGEDDPALTWYAQFTPLYETMAKKRYAKLILRLELGSAAFVRIMERVDGSPWKQIGRITAGEKNPVTVPVPIARGDKMEFRLEGKGACTILSIERQFFIGSEV